MGPWFWRSRTGRLTSIPSHDSSAIRWTRLTHCFWMAASRGYMIVDRGGLISDLDWGRSSARSQPQIDRLIDPRQVAG